MDTKEIGYNICQEIKALNKSVKTAFIVMAEKLKQVRDEKLYIGGGHETFWQFCEEDLEMSESTASKMITVYEKLVLRFGISPAKLVKSWNSAYLIAQACETKEQVEELLDKDLPPSELKKELAEKKGGENHTHHFKEVHLRQCEVCGLKEKIHADE